jgi:hypothetical protein
MPIGGHHRIHRSQPGDGGPGLLWCCHCSLMSLVSNAIHTAVGMGALSDPIGVRLGGSGRHR